MKTGSSHLRANSGESIGLAGCEPAFLQRISGRLKNLTKCGLLVVMAMLGVSCFADGSEKVLDRARALEAEGMSLLSEYLRFEEELLAEDNDRVLVFLSMPHGARVIVDEIRLSIDGEQVERYVYSAGELVALRQRATQLVYASRIKRGEHTLMVNVRTMQGSVVPMKPYAFIKGRASKFMEIVIAGLPIRQIGIQEW